MARFRIDDSDTPTIVDGWTAISSSKSVTGATVSGSKTPAEEARAAAERVLGELLQCDHLMVLAGLGTSLCIKDSGGKTVFPTMPGLWAQVKGAVESEDLGLDDFGRICAHVNYTDQENIEDLLSRCLMAVELARKPDENAKTLPDVQGFIKTAEKTIRDACRKTLNPEATAWHEEFLRRLTRRAPRRPRPCVFTTNYDLCFDVAAARIGLTVIDGFSFSVPPRFQPEMFDYDVVTSSSYSKEPDFVPRLLRLYKLHGSVDWHRGEEAIEKNPDTEQPVLIYPQSGKYAASYSPPFLELMSRFQGMLRNRNVGLLVVGCGLNDRHLAEPLLAAIKSNTSLRVTICAPDLCDNDAQTLHSKNDVEGTAATNTLLRQVNQLIDNGDSRLTFFNGSFSDLVKLMPMLPVQTDAEQHESRIKKLEMWVAKQRTEPGAGA